MGRKENPLIQCGSSPHPHTPYF